MMDTMMMPPPGHRHSNQMTAMSSDPPIDPSLAIDPAILGQSSNHLQSAPSQYSSRRSSPTSALKFNFEQGPQGDPFAPQQGESFIQPCIPSVPRSLKRKRKTRPAARRDDDCSFCQGDDSNNKNGQSEEMVSCVACGRSGHPSCLGIEGIACVLRSYPWHCIECKLCEVCEKKGNGNRMLFCDACDRGWHMDCLDPPLESTPDGSWVCPLCPPIPPEGEAIRLPSLTPVYIHVSASPAPSIASSSRIPQQTDPKPRSRKGKRKAPEDEDANDDEPPRVRHKPEAEARRGRGAGKGRDAKGKGRARTFPPEESTLLPGVIPLRHVSSKGRSRSPDSAVHPMRKVRLVVRKPKGLHDDKDDNEQDNGSHMFEGVLKPEEYSTANTHVVDSDKSLFNRSRTRAEVKLGPPVAPPPFPSSLPTPGPSTPTASTPTAVPSSGPTSGLLHALRTRHSLAQALHAQLALDAPSGTLHTPFHNQADPPLPLRIRTIRFGEYDIDTWYDAPFPEEYASVADGKLWMCEFCLKYMKSRFQSTRHRMKCKARHPPGDEIYRDGVISVFEVDGRKNKIYCQNLCLLSKMFLDHKSLFYDVEPFLFYVMTEVDRLGARFVGYFSKEKRSPKNYNVSCIMTLPVRQRRGWGNILIDFSYLLSKKENRVGSPERPLSALGVLAYRQYWTHTIKMFLHTASNPVKLEDISRATAMTLEDIYSTLREQNLIVAREVIPPPPVRPPPGTPIKYLRGRKNGPGVTRRGLARTNTKEGAKVPLLIPTEYTVHWDREELDAYASGWHVKDHLMIHPRCLKWSPFLLARARKSSVAGVEGSISGDVGGSVAVTEIDRSSASSTKVTQGAPLDVAISTPKQPDESKPLELAHVADTRSPSLLVDLVDAEDPKPPAQRSTSCDAIQVAEDRALATELTRVYESPHRTRSTRSKSLHQASADQARLPPSVSQNMPRNLRPRPPANHVRQTRNTDDDDTDDGTADETDFLPDGSLAANLVHYERSSRTRSASYKDDPPKAATHRPPPIKRRRVEESPEPLLEPDFDDADGSLSELTRTSTSPPSSPPPRRVTRVAQNGARRENGMSSLSVRSTRTNTKPLASGVRSSSRINGATRIPSVVVPLALKKTMVVEEARDGRNRNPRRAKADMAHNDGHGEVQPVAGDHSHRLANQADNGKEDRAGASFLASLNGTALNVNGKGSDNGTPGGCGTPGMYDEDALGEEDAEGEEDPNPESDAEG